MAVESKPKTRPKINDYRTVRDLLRRMQLRATQSRVAVLQILKSAQGPITHAEVTEKLAPRGFDKASIFRNLIELSEAGLLLRLELGDHVWRYELRGDETQEKDNHLHFLCTDCGRISCLAGVSVGKALTAATKQAVIGVVADVLLKGRCVECNTSQ